MRDCVPHARARLNEEKCTHAHPLKLIIRGIDNAWEWEGEREGRLFLPKQSRGKEN
jgi:hypothetical protein